MRHRSVRLVLFVALIFLASSLAPAAGRAESPSAVLAGRVEADQWAANPFPARAGASYVLTLTPAEGDADLYLYFDGREVARSLNAGPTDDQVRWTAGGDGTAVAWVYGYRRATSYRLSVEIDEGAARARATSRGGTVRKVGLQAGHWRRSEAPYPFNTHSGSTGGGKTEDEVNLAIARRTADILKDDGHAVDVLPTVIPKGYLADVVVAIHADGGPASRRGFFADRPARSATVAAEARLVELLEAEYAEATGIPHVYRGTENTRFYYGYYSVNPRTPMVLIETGFLSNPTDRTVIVDRPDLAAAGIASAIRRFLDE